MNQANTAPNRFEEITPNPKTRPRKTTSCSKSTARRKIAFRVAFANRPFFFGHGPMPDRLRSTSPSSLKSAPKASLLRRTLIHVNLHSAALRAVNAPLKQIEEKSTTLLTALIGAAAHG